MKDLLKSRAVWTAFLSLISAVVMYYLDIPAEIWQSFLAFAFVIIGIFTVDDLGITEPKAIQRMIAKRSKSKSE